MVGGRPLIGVSTYLESARWGVWELEAALLPVGYPRLVRDAGGLAAMLPPDDPAHAAAVVARLDGLVIAGVRMWIRRGTGPLVSLVPGPRPVSGTVGNSP